MVSIAEGSSGAVTGFSRDYFEHFGYTLSVNYGLLSVQISIQIVSAFGAETPSGYILKRTQMF
jgi:hypothetical protein